MNIKISLHSTFFLECNIPHDLDSFIVDGIPVCRIDDPKFKQLPSEWEIALFIKL